MSCGMDACEMIFPSLCFIRSPKCAISWLWQTQALICTILVRTEPHAMDDMCLQRIELGWESMDLKPCDQTASCRVGKVTCELACVFAHDGVHDRQGKSGCGAQCEVIP